MYHIQALRAEKYINDEAGFLTGGCQVYCFVPFPRLQAAWRNGDVFPARALILRLRSHTTAQFLSDTFGGLLRVRSLPPWPMLLQNQFGVLKKAAKLFLKVANCWSLLGLKSSYAHPRQRTGHGVVGCLLQSQSWLRWLWKGRMLKKGCISIIPSSCCNLNAWGFCSNHFHNMLSILCTSYCKLGQNSAIVVAWLQKWRWSSTK